VKGTLVTMMKNQMTRVGFLCAHWCLGVLRSGALNSGLVDLRLLTCSECSACVHAACVQHPTELVGWRRNDWRCRLCRQKMHKCHVCSATGAADVRRCRVSWCGRYHHTKCVGGAVDARRVCPRHRCATCSGAIDDVESVFLACVRCEKLYHAAPECRPSSDAVILLEQRFDSDDDRIVFVRCATHVAPPPPLQPLGAAPSPSFESLDSLLQSVPPTLLSKAPPAQVELESDSSSDAECAATRKPSAEKRKRPAASPPRRKRPGVTRADNDFAPASSSSSSSEEAVPEPEPEPAAAAAAAASVKSSTPSTPSKPKKPQQASPPAKPVVAKPSAPIVAVRKPQREFETAPIVAAVAKPTPVVVAVPQPSVPVVASAASAAAAATAPIGPPRRVLHLKPTSDLKKLTPTATTVPNAAVTASTTTSTTGAAATTTTTAAAAATASTTASAIAESKEFEKNKQRLAEQRAQSQQTLLDSMMADFKVPKRKVEPEAAPVKKERAVLRESPSPTAPVRVLQPPTVVPQVVMPRMTAWDCFFAERAPFAAEVLGAPLTSPPVFAFLQQQWHSLTPAAQQTYVATADAHEHRRMVALDQAERQRFAAAHPEAFECPVCALFITEDLFWPHYEFEVDRKARNAMYRLSGVGAPPAMWKH
jgi:hypothetical protein